jgi:hypothetical protein
MSGLKGRASPSVKWGSNCRCRWMANILSRAEETDWTLVLMPIGRFRSNMLMCRLIGTVSPCVNFCIEQCNDDSTQI